MFFESAAAFLCELLPIPTNRWVTYAMTLLVIIMVILAVYAANR
jgi:hypothetical protein